MVGRGELTDKAWVRIAPLLPAQSGQRGGRWRSHRQVIDAALAADLLAWTQTLAFDQHEPARRWEPKRLRLRILTVAGRIIHSGRRHRLRLPRDWPYNHLIDTGYAALCST